jgi:hypothetical protein
MDEQDRHSSNASLSTQLPAQEEVAVDSVEAERKELDRLIKLMIAGHKPV